VLHLFESARLLYATCLALALGLGAGQAFAQNECKAKVFLTLDTGGMHQAESIAKILKQHQVKATFFLANEKTFRGDYALDASWGEFWRARAAEGHQFGSHTFDHVYFIGGAEPPGGSTRTGQAAPLRESSPPKPQYKVRPQFGQLAGKNLLWDERQICRELNRVDDRFRELTRRSLAAIWRAPGGRAPNSVMAVARACGYEHVFWASAGFLGDELPSEKYSNEFLLSKALREVRDGDILMAHLGIWSRKDPFAPMLEPLISGLKANGFCFETIAAGTLVR
jgi:peptidoglycan/xylan/chitin deacetylase (PgdA/CDA1 family)